MVIKHNNFITPEELKWFRQDMDHRIDTKQYVERSLPDDLDIAKVYGVDDPSRVMEYRTPLLDDNDLARKKINDYVLSLFPVKWYYAAYQRQFYPQQLHGDYLPKDADTTYAYSMIIPLDDNPYNIFKTIVWKQQVFEDEDVSRLIRKFYEENAPRTYSNSTDYDLEHVTWYASSIVDSLELDGTYNYELGTAGQFHRSQMHCSSNWKKHNLYTHKDFIIIHVDS